MDPTSHIPVLIAKIIPCVQSHCYTKFILYFQCLNRLTLVSRYQKFSIASDYQIKLASEINIRLFKPRLCSFVFIFVPLKLVLRTLIIQTINVFLQISPTSNLSFLRVCVFVCYNHVTLKANIEVRHSCRASSSTFLYLIYWDSVLQSIGRQLFQLEWLARESPESISALQ